ncbi:MAG: hypothetical protein LBV72_10170 [Tannerella sp.]|jgi:hypothetical protein|nr:hypothetical protein [Tannerella sp.]
MATNKEKEIMKRIKTVKDAREATGRPEIDFSNLPEDLRDHFAAYYDALVVVEALNEGRKPDWGNTDERKWYPWFDMSPAGFAFGSSDCDRGNAGAGSGSRLKLFSEEMADYAAKQFPEIWEKVQLK